MKIIEVNNKKSWRLFHQVLDKVYQDDSNYIHPLQHEIEQVFDPKHNKTLQDGTAKCFVLLDDQHQAVGRIAAFIDHTNQKPPFKTGGIGFFECIDQPEYVALLFDMAEQYLKDQDIALVDGPVNFGERDRFWGLLVKGYDPPLYQENYHPAYYEQYFLDRNYVPFEQILTYKGASKKIPFQRLAAIAKRLHERHPVEVRPLNFKRLDEFAQDFSVVYNASFKQFPHFKPISGEQVKHIMEQAKPIADPGIACIAYYEGNPAGFIALYPDINPFLKHAKGKLNWMSIPGFLWKNHFAKTKTAKGMGFGIHPEYQSKGIFALLVDYLCTPENLQKYPYMCLAQIRTHNHEIRSMYDKLEVEIDRVHVAYRKALRPEAKIEPFEFIEV
ncbi:MAG: hypothetical protein DHS20C18_45290 [Saprospiraceae bacterium]|nr:MAG: hypothetical protein DHS20C18_45290 [Saprospiraceae bacterium]